MSSDQLNESAPDGAPAARPKKSLLESSLFRNWIGISGWLVLVSSLFTLLLLLLLSILARDANPYVGILLYIVTPGFFLLGVGLILWGWLLDRWRLGHAKPGVSPSRFTIDLTRPRDRRILGGLLGAAAVFLLISSIGGYHSYHFTESVTFCGQACHTVMQPEMDTYQHGPHARVACTECHIGPGATWFVRSKLSGTYQVYATLWDKYPRPIPTPIKNLRPAQETCERCHWPQKFAGDVVRTYRHYLSDEENSEYTCRLLLKVGGGDPSRGPAGGIHWHMNVANKVEYVALDEKRLDIPWVRLTDTQGVVTEFRTPEFTNDLSEFTVRTMDCMDCHNRPAHIFRKPNSAVDQAITLGRIDRSLPRVRATAAELLVGEYATTDQAMKAIATGLVETYGDTPKSRQAVESLQQIYRDNFFPAMKADWRVYPDHIGHKDWPGCVRCHDDNHVSADGKKTIAFSDCNACHLLLAQGSGDELDAWTISGQPFKHPGEEWDRDFKCNDCHSGGP